MSRAKRREASWRPRPGHGERPGCRAARRPARHAQAGELMRWHGPQSSLALAQSAQARARCCAPSNSSRSPPRPASPWRSVNSAAVICWARRCRATRQRRRAGSAAPRKRATMTRAAIWPGWPWRGIAKAAPTPLLFRQENAEPDFATALRWALLAAAEGDVEAQVMAGLHLRRRTGGFARRRPGEILVRQGGGGRCRARASRVRRDPASWRENRYRHVCRHRAYPPGGR